MHQKAKSKGLELMNRAKRVLPSGVLGRHPQPEGLVHVPIKGKGSRIWNADGEEFIDYSLGGGSLILGYSNEKVLDAVRSQIQKATQFISIINEPAIEMAEVMAKALPWMGKVRFALSGAEAIFFAMRLARAFTGRDKILKFEGAYHGNNDYAMWSNETSLPPNYPIGEPNTAGMPNCIKDTVLIAPYNDISTTKSIVESNWKEIAGIIVEPVQRFYGPKEGFLEGLRSLADQFGIVLIFDEIVTGFRIAYGGAPEKFGVVPDLGVYGKHIGGGFPLSAIVGKSEIMELGGPEIKNSQPEKFVYVTSHQAGNPVGCAAGKVVLQELAEKEIFDRFLQNAEYLKSELRKMVSKMSIGAQVIGYGPLWDIVFCNNEIYDHRSSLFTDKKKQLLFHMGLVKSGVMVRVGGRSYFSTAHGIDEIEKTLQACKESLKQI